MGNNYKINDLFFFYGGPYAHFVGEITGLINNLGYKYKVLKGNHYLEKPRNKEIIGTFYKDSILHNKSIKIRNVKEYKDLYKWYKLLYEK